MKKLNIKLILSFIFLLFTLFLLLLTNFNNNKNLNDTSKLYFHVINVGQGDALLFQVNNKNILIDSGSISAKTDLLDYLNNLQVKTIDYLIETHPHEDHIGNMDTIINSFNVKSFYGPKITTNTKTYEDMINALKDNNLKINVSKSSKEIDLGKGAKILILSPISDDYGDNLNNYSTVIKLTYYNTSFLCTGDAEKVVENQLLESKFNLKSDVLKVAHHGSSTSTSPDFLKAVSPKYAAISVSKINDYGHPDQVILNELKKFNVKTFLTYNGSIIFTSDGNKVNVSR